MNVLKFKRSNLVINILIASVISLTINFSYLLSMIVAERESNDQRQRIEQEMMERPECSGIFHLSPDGYGYIIPAEKVVLEHPMRAFEVDSIFVSNRKVAHQLVMLY